ncbi:hypothetical protein ABT369_56380 [Dactylosporangium sp. NPDC000244]|uniref:hypothetical protein n=1 Tax=Dactylosporangium sp. NPDC000244 TaxID=3154365 RepID=UPI00331E6AC8
MSPLVHADRLNVFQVAVLGLARAGFREAADIGRLLGLQDDLVELVRSDLRALNYLDTYGVITTNGRHVLQDGFPDPTRAITTYVYQDVTTGTLWPASTVEPGHCQCDWQSPRTAMLQLGTVGAPVRVHAFAVHPDGWTGTEPPAHEQVVEAVSRGEAAKRQGGGRTRRWRAGPPERVVSRVSVMTEGQPVWIPLPLLARKRDEGGESTVTWDAMSPFGGHASPYLRRLVATRIQRSARLRDHVEQFVGRRTEGLLAESDLIDVKLRRSIAETLEHRFTTRVRDHDALFELLTLLEREIDRARRRGDGSPEVGDVARYSWRLHELVLRDLVARHRPPRSAIDRLRDPLARQLGIYCRQLGMSFGEHAQLGKVDADQLRRGIRQPDRASTPVLLAASLVSAANGAPDHPFRQVAATRPTLLSDLTNVSQDRNTGGAHAAAMPLNLDYGETAWRLAQDTAAAYLGVPLPDLRTRSEGNRSTNG